MNLESEVVEYTEDDVDYIENFWQPTATRYISEEERIRIAEEEAEAQRLLEEEIQRQIDEENARIAEEEAY